jgi:hypothetical protein
MRARPTGEQQHQRQRISAARNRKRGAGHGGPAECR